MEAGWRTARASGCWGGYPVLERYVTGLERGYIPTREDSQGIPGRGKLLDHHAGEERLSSSKRGFWISIGLPLQGTRSDLQTELPGCAYLFVAG